IRDVADLGRKWEDHLRMLSKMPIPVSPARLDRIETDCMSIATEFAVRSSAGWARTPQLGAYTIRLKVTDMLTSLLHFLEEEKKHITVLQAKNCNVQRPAMKPLA